MKIGSVCAIIVWVGIFGGCSAEIDSPATAAVSAFNTAGAPTVEFNAPDMMCPEGCGAKVKQILSAQPGAKDVVINFETKTATVAVDQEKFDPEAAIAALKDYGFDHSTLKSSNTNAEPAAEPEAKPAG